MMSRTAKRAAFLIALATAACVSSAPSCSFDDGGAADASGTNDARVDAGPCDLGRQFLMTATHAFDNVNDSRNQSGASLSPDERTLYVQIDDHLYIAKRN